MQTEHKDTDEKFIRAVRTLFEQVENPTKDSAAMI